MDIESIVSHLFLLWECVAVEYLLQSSSWGEGPEVYCPFVLQMKLSAPEVAQFLMLTTTPLLQHCCQPAHNCKGEQSSSFCCWCCREQPSFNICLLFYPANCTHSPSQVLLRWTAWKALLCVWWIKMIHISHTLSSVPEETLSHLWLYLLVFMFFMIFSAVQMTWIQHSSHWRPTV